MDNAVAKIDTSLESLLSGLNHNQREYLTLIAMNCDVVKARNLVNISDSTITGWRKSDDFCLKEMIVEKGDMNSEALTVYLDSKLPYVMHELVSICLSGGNGDKPHKDKEKAIEFFLKDLCGVSKHVNKEMGFYRFLEERKEVVNA